MAEVEDDLGGFAEAGEAGVELFRGKFQRVVEPSDGFESAEGVEAGGREQPERADEVRAAEEVGDLLRGADAGHEFRGGPRAHGREVIFVVAEPQGGVLPRVFLVFRRLLQRRERAGRRQRPAREERAQLGRREWLRGRVGGERGNEDRELEAFHGFCGILCRASRA